MMNHTNQSQHKTPSPQPTSSNTEDVSHCQLLKTSFLMTCVLDAIDEHILEVKLIQNQLYGISTALLYHKDHEVQERGRKIAQLAAQINDWLEKLHTTFTQTSRYCHTHSHNAVYCKTYASTIKPLTSYTLEETLEELQEIEPFIEKSFSLNSHSHFLETLQQRKKDLLDHLAQLRRSTPSPHQ